MQTKTVYMACDILVCRCMCKHFPILHNQSVVVCTCYIAPINVGIYLATIFTPFSAAVCLLTIYVCVQFEDEDYRVFFVNTYSNVAQHVICEVNGIFC